MMLCDLYHTHTTLSKGPSPWECSWAPGGPGRTPAVGVRSLAGPVSLSRLTLVGSVAARYAHGIWKLLAIFVSVARFTHPGKHMAEIRRFAEFGPI